MSVGFNTFKPKVSGTKFIVQNNSDRRIGIFTVRLSSGQQYDLMNIPQVSEADIRHSLLKGDLLSKLRTGDLRVIESTIDLTQFDSEQKAFLESVGVVFGLDPDVNNIQGNPITTNDPSDGYVLIWDESEGLWVYGLQPPTLLLTNDLGGSYNSPIVTGIQGNPISDEQPQDGYFLTWSDSEGMWRPCNDLVSSGTLVLTNDLGGTFLQPLVVGIQGNEVDASVPEDGYTLIWSVQDNAWVPKSSILINPTIVNDGYREVLPPGSSFYTSAIWYTDTSKTQTIFEELITRNGVGLPTVITHRYYDTLGNLSMQVEDTITYINLVESNRTRTVT